MIGSNTAGVANAVVNLPAVGGGALMAYVTQARVSAAEAERALRENAVGKSMQHTLAQLVFDHGAIAAVLVDADGRIVAINKNMRQGLGVGEGVGRGVDRAREPAGLGTTDEAAPQQVLLDTVEDGPEVTGRVLGPTDP